MNFGRAATALRLVIRRAYGIEGEKTPEMMCEIEGLEPALKAHSKYLEPLAKQILRDEVELDI